MTKNKNRLCREEIELLPKGGWHPQPKKALRAISRRTDLCAEDSRNSWGTEEKIVFLASFSKPLIKGGRRPQPIKDGASESLKPSGLEQKLVSSASFWNSLLKVELHVHLDCCLSFDVVSQLKPGITREEYAADFVGRPKYKNLADFLEIIDHSLELMQTRESLRLVTEDLFQQFKKDRVIYAEIRFAPLLHLRRGLSPAEVVKTVEESVSRCVKETGIEARVILCTLRHHTEEQSMATVELAGQFAGTRVAALDLSADEAGFPIDAHIAAFRYAQEKGIYCTAHAGEARGPESIRETLEYFKPTRIGHGVRCIEDPLLPGELKRRGIHLEVCPSCNVQIDVFNTYADHPIDRLYKAGVSVGINTDGRTITDITLSDEYERLQQTFGWGIEHFFACNRNALEAAFLPGETRAALLDRLNADYKNFAFGDQGALLKNRPLDPRKTFNN